MSDVQLLVIALNIAAFVAMVTAFVVTGKREVAEETAQGDLDLPPLTFFE